MFWSLKRATSAPAALPSTATCSTPYAMDVAKRPARAAGGSDDYSNSVAFFLVR